ncbi:MAG: O-antigen ligase family protein, partial [Stellaceae bacterium]
MRFLNERTERLITYVYLLILANVFWPPDGYLVDPSGANQGASDRYDSTAFALLAVFLGIALLARWQQTLRLLRLGWPVMVLIGLAFLSAFWAEVPILVIRRSGTVTLTSLFGIYLVGRYEFGELVAMLVKIYALAMLASLVMIVTFPSLAIGHNEDYIDAWRGAFTDKNTLGLSAAITMIVSVYAFHRRFGSRWLSVAALAMGVVAFMLANSKTPLVDLVAAVYCGVLVVMLRRRNGFGLITAFVFAVLGLAAIGLFTVDPAGILEALGRNPTLTDRAKIWHYVIDYIVRRPWLGYGFGGFWRSGGVEANQIWAMVHFKTPHAHNAWLEVGLSLGVAGMGLVAVNWLVAIYRVARLVTAPAAHHVAFC